VTPQSIQGDDGAARVIDSKDPFTSNAGIKVRLRPKGPGFVQRFNGEVVTCLLGSKSRSSTDASRPPLDGSVRRLHIDKSARVEWMNLHE